MNNFEMWDVLEDHGIDIVTVFTEMFETLPENKMREILERIEKNVYDLEEKFALEEESVKDYRVTFGLRGDYSTWVCAESEKDAINRAREELFDQMTEWNCNDVKFAIDSYDVL